MSLPPYLEALALTLIVEVPIYCLLLTIFMGIRAREALTAAIVVNLVSHPLFTFVLVPTLDRLLQPVAAVFVGEIVVCALEAGMISAGLRRDPFVAIATALIANGCSLAAGLVLFGWVLPR